MEYTEYQDLKCGDIIECSIHKKKGKAVEFFDGEYDNCDTICGCHNLRKIKIIKQKSPLPIIAKETDTP